MRILAYCDKRYELVTREGVVGWEADCLTSPPIFAGTFSPDWFQGYEFIYLDIHGQPSSVYLYSGPNQEWAALSLKTVEAARIDGAVIFATTCFLPETKFLEAFLKAGARAVVAGEGENYAGRQNPAGAQSLAGQFLRQLKSGLSPETALEQAKIKLRKPLLSKFVKQQAVEDALAFKLWK